MRTATVLGVLGIAAALASPASADEFSGFRLGLNLSQEQMDSDLYLGAIDETNTLNNIRFGYGLMGGWALNKWFAVEATLQSGSEFNADTFRPLLAADEYIKSHTDVKGLEASAVGTFWIGKRFAVFGRVGMLGWKAEQTLSAGIYDDPDTRGTASKDDTGFDPVFGIGLQTMLDGALVRLEYKMSEIGDLTLNDLGDPDDPNDDSNVFSLRNTELSSVQFSIVWNLH